MNMRATTMKAGRSLAGFLAMLLLVAVGCGSDDDGERPAATPTATETPVGNTPLPTATPNGTPPSSVVNGTFLVHRDVRAGAGDALGVAEFDFVGPGFDRTLSHADWSLLCDGAAEPIEGSTDDMGRFSAINVPAGECIMTVTKTVGGNLMVLEVPFSVGDDGAEVVAEVSWGRVRVTSSYESDGEEVRSITTNGGAKVVVRGGSIVEIKDYSRHLIDEDGDGAFETPGCDGAVWQCNEFEACGEGRFCSCTASCPFCEDCGPPVCVAPAPSNPYACNDDGSCINPADRCVCASSSPDTDDCPQQVCVPSCQPVEIEGITVYGSDQMTRGQESSFSAVMELSDGSAMNITGVADWASSDTAILAAGAWGVVSAVGTGTALITASFDDLSSGPFTVVVRPRPPLVRITLQNIDCYPPPGIGLPVPEPFLVDEAFVPVSCADAVEIGGSLQYQAFGEFEDFYYEDITDEVAWSVDPASVATVVGGLLTGTGEGTATVRASLDGIDSHPLDIRVVTERSIVDISIYPDHYFYYDFLAVTDLGPCFGAICPGTATVLLEDEVQFHATARFDIGGWEDVTDQVDWSSEPAGVVSFDDGGTMTAVGEGETLVRASLDDVESFPWGVRVVAEATVQQLEVYQEGSNAGDRVIEAGGEAYFKARGFYDVGFDRDATDDVEWRTNDEAVARFDRPGVLTGLSAGSVAVWAELDGVRSRELFMEVFEQTDIAFCDVANVNRGTWTDGFNRVYLESDCADYAASEVVQIRFTVTETERPPGIFDPCLDLYAFRVDGSSETFVRTIREEGCGEPFLEAGAPEFDDATLRYQLQAFWDLRDDSGSPVGPGTYRIKGRFYLYYDPVVTIDVTVD